MFVFVNYLCNMHRSVCKQGIQPIDRINWWFRVVFFNLPTTQFLVSKYWGYLYVINLHHSVTIGLFTWLLFNCTCIWLLGKGVKNAFWQKQNLLGLLFRCWRVNAIETWEGFWRTKIKLDQVYCAWLIKWVVKREKVPFGYTVRYETKWYWLVLDGTWSVYGDTSCWYFLWQ